jgi:ArsR family transcriptional regulator
MVADFDTVVGGLRAAAEPTRLRLLALCARVELTVSELTEILGQSQPRVSRHLKVLCDGGLLVRVREGTNAFYRVATEGPEGDLVRYLVATLDGDDAALAPDFARLDTVRRQRVEIAAAYFRRNAAHWDEIRSLHVDEAEVESALLALLPGDRVGDHLDIGTGTGRILELIAPHADRAIGIDLSREMLAVARTRLERPTVGHCRLRKGDMYRLPWPEDSFDLVTFHQVMHYADDPGAALAEAARVLRPGGRLIVVDFAPHHLEYLRSEHAHRRLGLGDDEVAAWFEAAGLQSAPATALPGTQLTVKVWAADRPAAAAAQPRRLAAGGQR